MAAAKNELCDSIEALQSHYSIANGFMLHAGNREIVVSLAKEIDYKFNSILRDCAEFGEGDQLPGVSLKKTDLRQSKIEFDNRVKDWLVCVNSTSSKNILRPQTPPALPNESFESFETRSEAYSHSSSLTLKQKERHVKLRVAMAKKEKEAERVRLAEETERVLFEADKRLESVKREVAQLKQKAKRDAEMRERSWEVQLAKVEAKAWTECSSSTVAAGLVIGFRLRNCITVVEKSTAPLSYLKGMVVEAIPKVLAVLNL